MLPGRAIVLTGLGNAVTLVLGRVRSDRTGGNGSGQPECEQTGDCRLNSALLLHGFSSADGNERSAKTDQGWPISSPWSPRRCLPYTKSRGSAGDSTSLELGDRQRQPNRRGQPIHRYLARRAFDRAALVDGDQP